MNSLSKVYIGIDVSKKYLDVHCFPLKKDLRIVNSKNGIKKFLDQLKDYDVEQIVFEATGGYECHLLTTLKTSAHKFWQVDPRRIRAYIISEGIKVKTDQIDARMIALFASEKKQNYQPIQLSPVEEQLKALNTRRSDLLSMVNIEENRLKHPQQIFCKDILKRHVLFMKKQIKNVENKIKLLIKSDDMISRKVEICKSIPGIGDVAAATLVAEMPELGKIADKKIASLLGVAPIIQQSGINKGTAAIKGGRSNVRKVIYMAALVSIQCNPVFKEFYTRLCSAGKKPKLVLVAVMRKLIVTLNAMLLKGELWQCKMS